MQLSDGRFDVRFLMLFQPANLRGHGDPGSSELALRQETGVASEGGQSEVHEVLHLRKEPLKRGVRS